MTWQPRNEAFCLRNTRYVAVFSSVFILRFTEPFSFCENLACDLLGPSSVAKSYSIFKVQGSRFFLFITYSIICKGPVWSRRDRPRRLPPNKNPSEQTGQGQRDKLGGLWPKKNPGGWPGRSWRDRTGGF